jgi:hypothetical protein
MGLLKKEMGRRVEREERDMEEELRLRWEVCPDTFLNIIVWLRLVVLLPRSLLAENRIR